MGFETKQGATLKEIMLPDGNQISFLLRDQSKSPKIFAGDFFDASILLIESKDSYNSYESLKARTMVRRGLLLDYPGHPN